MHNQADDCWVIVNDLVLDVTLYMDKHPGGKQLVFRSAGKDVTRDFAAMFHSVRAKAKLEELCVGAVAHKCAVLWFDLRGAGRLKGSRAPTHLDPFRAPMPLTASPAKGPYGLSAAGAKVVPLPLARPTLRVDDFLALRLLSSKPESPGCKTLAFELPVNAPSTLLAFQHVRVRWNGEARSYTPVAWRRGAFELLVKEYAAPQVRPTERRAVALQSLTRMQGVMSRHLCALKAGDTLDVCGPLASGFDWLKYRAAHPGTGLLLVSMGTGITPMVQLLRDVQAREWGRGKAVRVHLFHAARSAEHLMLAPALVELEAMAGPDQLTFHTYYSLGGDTLTPVSLLQRLAASGSGAAGLAFLRDFAMVACGTDAFVQAFRDSFAEQMSFYAV